MCLCITPIFCPELESFRISRVAAVFLETLLSEPGKISDVTECTHWKWYNSLAHAMLTHRRVRGANVLGLPSLLPCPPLLYLKSISPSSFYLCGQAPHGHLHQTETFGVLPLHVCVCCSAIVRGNHAEVKEGQERWANTRPNCLMYTQIKRLNFLGTCFTLPLLATTEK